MLLDILHELLYFFHSSLAQYTIEERTKKVSINKRFHQPGGVRAGVAIMLSAAKNFCPESLLVQLGDASLRSAWQYEGFSC